MHSPRVTQRQAHQLILFSMILTSACAGSGMSSLSNDATGSDGPANPGTVAARQDGDANAGRNTFRFETFGNEGFWTDAVRLPQGIIAKGVTPLQALRLGVGVDVDALDAATQRTLAEQLRRDPTGRTSAILNDPKMTLALVNANAIIGMPIKDSNDDGILDASICGYS